MMIWWSVTGRKIDRSSRTRSCIGEMMNMKTPEFGLKFGEILHYPRQLSQVTLAQSFGIRLRAGPTALWTPRPIFAAVLSNFQTKNVLVSQRFPCHFHLKDQLKEESYYIVYSSLRGISIRVESSSFHLDLLWQLQLGIHFYFLGDLSSPWHDFSKDIAKSPHVMSPPKLLSTKMLWLPRPTVMHKSWYVE